MSRAMVVTVGTSLFHSATWEHRGPLQEVPDYEFWLQDELLRKPEVRHQDGTVRGGLEEALDLAGTREGASLWAAHLADELTREGPIAEPMRYSAEIATITLLADGRSLRSFLRSYDVIYLPCDPMTEAAGAEIRRSYVAALHLREYLERMVGDATTGVELWEIPHLADTEPRRLLDALVELRQRVEDHRDQYLGLDLVVTGGYKVYGYLLTTLLAPGVGEAGGTVLHYLYEGSPELLTLDAERVAMGNARVEFASDGYLPR